VSRLIVDCRANITMAEALEYAAVVVGKGRISNEGKQYCYVSSFKDGIVAHASVNKTSDRIVITGKRAKVQP